MTDLPPGVVARQVYVDAARDDRDPEARDRAGRRSPRMFSFLKLMTRFSARSWKRIPDEFWALDVNDEGYSVAVVSCVCGATPRAEVLAPSVQCDGCDRQFYFGGDRVLSIRPPGSA